VIHRLVTARPEEAKPAATRLLTAEEHLRKRELAARRGMWLAAADQFQPAVHLNDNDAEHHANLAWSRWNATENKDGVYAEVRKTLLRATELSDRCVPAFFFLAQVYSARNELDRAYNTFQRVLSLNENHVEARREVRIIEMRRAKGSERKGLFDLFKKK
jgi:tetratricopeptide (TPR) repeat protein